MADVGDPPGMGHRILERIRAPPGQPPRLGPNQPRQEPQQRRFARPVRPHQQQRTPLGHAQGQIREHQALAAERRQSLRLQQPAQAPYFHDPNVVPGAPPPGGRPSRPMVYALLSITARPTLGTGPKPRPAAFFRGSSHEDRRT